MTGKSRWGILILALAPLLTAALWMDHQPSYKTYRAPVPPAPEGSVPVTGREGAGLAQVPAGQATPERGKELFAINCAMCHGATSAERGPVGRKLVPPPPGLDHEMVQGLSDATIFQAMTDGFGRMPSFKKKLSPEERLSLIAYLRTRR